VSVRFRVDLYSVSIRVLVSSFGSAQLYQPFLIGPAATKKKKGQIIHFHFLFFYITEKYIFFSFLFTKNELYILQDMFRLVCRRNEV
jgi:hypothetical protein